MTPTKDYAKNIFNLLKEHYSQAKMILQWENNFELLVAIILSAQCTDKKVNEVTTNVFPKYRQEMSQFEKEYVKYSRINLPKQELVELINMAFTPIHQLEQDVRSTGFYHNKAKHIQQAAKIVLQKYKGILPRSIAELTTIPGVGRKTANVFLTNAYRIDEGIAVDTHVMKQSQALGLTKGLPAGKAGKTPEKIEQDLMKLFPQREWHQLTYMLIEHGRNMRKKKSDRQICHNPDCILCK